MVAQHWQALARDNPMAGVKNGSRASRERRINGKHTHEASRGNYRSHRPDFSDVGNKMTQQILNAVAQRGRR